MGGRTGKAILAAALSLVVPGAGQLYLGERRRALVLFALFAACCIAALLVVGIGRELALSSVGRTLLAALLLANAAVLGLRLFAILDAGRGAFASRVAAVALAVLARRGGRAPRRRRVRRGARLQRARRRLRERGAEGRDPRTAAAHGAARRPRTGRPRPARPTAAPRAAGPEAETVPRRRTSAFRLGQTRRERGGRARPGRG